MAHGTAHDTPQHIAAPLIGGQHTIGNEKGGRAQMVGNHAVADAVVAVNRRAGHISRRLNQVKHQIRVIIIMLALQHRANALQPHAGVNGGFGQVNARAIALLFKLHKDQIPNLNKAVAIFIGAAGRAAFNIGAVVVKDFRTGAARASIAH